MFFKSNERKIRELEQKLKATDTNHILHLLLSVVTAGIWLPLWLLIGLNNAGNKRMYNSKINKLIDGV